MSLDNDNVSGGFAIYQLYNALRLHFTTKSYDYFKYHGKTNVSKESFLQNKSKYQFYRLSRKYSLEEAKEFFVANFLEDRAHWVGEMLSGEAEESYNRWRTTRQALTYNFTSDIMSLFERYGTDEMLRVPTSGYPKLLSDAMSNKIRIETLIILNDLLNFFPMWEKKIDDDIMWPTFKNKCLKYAPFMEYDKKKFKDLLIKEIKKYD